MAVSQPQFEGGGPQVYVRNTFLEVDDKPPLPLALQRAKTAPPPRSNSLIDVEDERRAGQDETSSSSEEEDDDEVAARVANRAAAAQAGGGTVTWDSYEPREDWKWVQSVLPASADNVKGNALVPSAIQGTSPAQDGEAQGQPPVMYPQTQPMVQMLPVMMSQIAPDFGPPASDSPNRQSCEPGRGAQWPEPVPLAPMPGQVSSGAVPPPAPALPGADDFAPLAAPQPQTLTRAFSINSSRFRVHWTVDARKLRGNDKQAVSPPFELSFGNAHPSVTFKMMIYPKVMNDSKGGASFKKAAGRGFVQLKCEAELAEADANVSFRIAIGSGQKSQAFRGPKLHNFSSSAVCGLAKEEEEWNFQDVVHSESQTFVVSLEIGRPDK